MGRVCCRLRLGGGGGVRRTGGVNLYCLKNAFWGTFQPLCAIIYIFYHFTQLTRWKRLKTAVCYMYLCEASPRAVRCAFGTAEKYRFMHIICTHKKHTHILVTAPLYPHTDATLYIHLTTQKTPLPFGGGADIVANNINYFSSPIACFMYALFASLAALLASRLTFK